MLKEYVVIPWLSLSSENISKYISILKVIKM